MAASVASPAATAHNVAQLLPKLHDADADFRYMALNDLHQIFSVASPTLLQHEHQVCTRTVDGLLNTLNDSNGEVQNMAVKCLGPFVNKIPDTVLIPMIDRISSMKPSKTLDRSVPALALRAVVVALPRPQPGETKSKAVNDAYTAVSRALIPRLVGQARLSQNARRVSASATGMVQLDLESGQDSNSLDLLNEVVKCFGSMLLQHEIQAMQSTVLDVIESEQAGSVLKKKSVVAFSTLVAYFPFSLLSAFISKFIEDIRSPHLTKAKRKLYINLLSALAKAVPEKFGPNLKTLAPFVLSALNDEDAENQIAGSLGELENSNEADDVRETALLALETFMTYCTVDMKVYIYDCTKAATAHIEYDPNLAAGDDLENEADGDDQLAGNFMGDDDFETDVGDDQEDDTSWKVRRCAAKLFTSIIKSYDGEEIAKSGAFLEEIGSILIPRLAEREESVRLEVLSAISLLINQTPAEANAAMNERRNEENQPLTMNQLNRKRRRGVSDASMLDLPHEAALRSPSTNSISIWMAREKRNALSDSLTQDLVRGLSHLFTRNTPTSTKEATIILLNDLVLDQQVGADESYQIIIPPLLDAANGKCHSIGSTVAILSTSSTVVSLRVHALQLMGSLLNKLKITLIQPYLTQIIQCLLHCARDRYSNVSLEALRAVEPAIIVLINVEASYKGGSVIAQTMKLFEILTNRINAPDADLAVKDVAIQVLGVILSEASGSESILTNDARLVALEVLDTKIRNELTRISSIKAIDAIVTNTTRSNELPQRWVRSVCTEICGQFRKASRPLRNASLHALHSLVLNPNVRTNLDAATTLSASRALLALLDTDRLHSLNTVLLTLTLLIDRDAEAIINDDFTHAISFLADASIPASAVDVFLRLTEQVGRSGSGRPLLNALLQKVGSAGSEEIIGKAIGTLLISGGETVGFTLKDFISELQESKNEQKTCLILSILGEVGLRLGPQLDLKPAFFTKFMTSKSDRISLAASMALGRCAANNANEYVPFILGLSESSAQSQYTVVQSIREMLRHKDKRVDLVQYTTPLWRKLISVSMNDDCRAIGVECIGRLTIVDPETYQPQLATFLSHNDASIRGIMVSALGFSFTESNCTYSEASRPTVPKMLTTMLNDHESENRRLALMTLTTGIHNKPTLIKGHAEELFQLVVRESVPRPELVRDVQMGPFKHSVDDGLELRKSAYETFYALLETMSSRLLIPNLYDRVIAGLSDQHEVRAICLLILTKIITLGLSETKNRLQSLAEAFRTVLSTKLSDNAVKTEIERLSEGQRRIMRASIMIQRYLDAEDENRWRNVADRSAGAQQVAWHEYWEWVRKNVSTLLRAAEEELSKDRDWRLP